MRSGTISSATYAPSNPPSDPADFSRFIYTELNRISAAINALALGHLDMATVIPVKPRDGDIRFADGVLWNPGSGKGIYSYYAAAWHFLG